jgi:outer membrane receptor protein involved in Fe transport
MRPAPALLLALLAPPVLASPVLAQTAPPPPAPAPQAELTVALPDVVVEAPRGPAAREAILSRIGVREVAVDRPTIEALPQGANAPLNQVLLQTPGVVQDSFGEIHIRGEHRGVQYRLNGIALPEGLSGFGQVFDVRGFSSVALLTGALPAQFGFRTNAVVKLEARSGALDPGGSVGVYGGSHGTVQPHASWAGLVGGWDVMATGNFQTSTLGIENPTSARAARHDATQQVHGLVSAARQLDDTTRLTLIGGTALNRFQIPTRPGVAPQFTVGGVGDFNSGDLRARQWERGWFGVAAVQKQLTDDVDVQVAGFTRYSSIHYLPDALGETIINGVASDVFRSSLTVGSQADAAWRLDQSHTLGAGLQMSRETSSFRASSQVLPLDGAGTAVDAPFTLNDRSSRVGWTYGAYLQDEWRLAERLTLNFGARADQMMGYVTAGQLSPRANLVWRATDATTLHAGYARTFTPPAQELVATTTLAKYVGTTNAPNSLVNDPVRPERAHRFDIGVTQRVTDNLTLGADAYYKAVRDLLDYGQFGNALIFTPFNYRQGRIYGVEFSGNWRSERWLVYANGAVSRATGRNIDSAQFNIDPAVLPQIQRKYVRVDHDQLFTGSAGAVYRAWESGRLSVSGLYGSGLRRGFANSEKLPNYGTVNLGLQQDFQLADGGLWTARLDVVNLFDSSYQLRDGTGIGVGAPQFGARRGVFVGLSRAL